MSWKLFPLLVLTLALMLALAGGAGAAATLDGSQSATTVPPGGSLSLTYTLTVPEGEPALASTVLTMPLSPSVTVTEVSGRGPVIVTFTCHATWVRADTGEPGEASASLSSRWPQAVLEPTVTAESVTLALPESVEPGESASLSITVERAPEP